MASVRMSPVVCTHDLDAALRRVLVAQRLDHAVRHALAHGVDQGLSARKNNASCFLWKCAVRAADRLGRGT